MVGQRQAAAGLDRLGRGHAVHRQVGGADFGLGGDVDVHWRAPIDGRLLDQPHRLGLGRREHDRHIGWRCAGCTGRGSDRWQVCQVGHRRGQRGVDAPGQQVVFQRRHRLAAQRFGMRRQQLGEERAAFFVGPADLVHALVQVLHQLRQLLQEDLALRRQALGLHAHHQFAAGRAHALGRRAVHAMGLLGAGDHAAPGLAQKLAQVVGHRQAGQCAVQFLCKALLLGNLHFLARQQFLGLAVGMHLRLFGDKAFQGAQRLGIDVNLIQIAIDDLLDQLLHPLQQRLAFGTVEVVTGAGQRGDAVDQSPYRVAPGREESRVAERRAQHRQLQPGDQPRHLWRHFGVGQDVVEQRRDDIDHHLVQAAVRRLAQLFAVDLDQVRLCRVVPGGPAACSGQAMAGRRPSGLATGAAAGDRVGHVVGVRGVTDALVQAPDHRHQHWIDLPHRLPATAAARGVAKASVAVAVADRRWLAARVAPVAGRIVPTVAMLAMANELWRARLLERRGARVARTCQRCQCCLARLPARRKTDRLDPGAAQIGHDVGIGLAHRLGQGMAQFGAQHLAHIGSVGHRLDGAHHRLADQLGAQGVALVLGLRQAQQAADVAVQLADLPLTGMGDFQRKAVASDAQLDLVVVDQFQRVPVGLGDVVR